MFRFLKPVSQTDIIKNLLQNQQPITLKFIPISKLKLSHLEFLSNSKLD